MKRNSRRQRGSIAVLAAVLLVVMLALVAFAVDVGYICLTKGRLQNVADAAALAAAGKLRNATSAEARDFARTYAELNTSTAEQVELLDQDIVLGHWDEQTADFTALTGDDEQIANAVQVTCTRSFDRGNQLRLCFSNLLGTPRADVAATAVARFKLARCGLIIGLTGVTMSGNGLTDSYDSEIASYQPSAGQSGHVCSNGNITMSGSGTINGNAHPGPGCMVNGSGSSEVTGNTQQLVEPLNFPPIDPGDASWQNDNGLVPTSDLGADPLDADNEFALSNGDGVNLAPGTYYFKKMTLSGDATVRVTGQTMIYVELDCDLSGGSIVNETSTPNLQLFPMGEHCTVSGSSEFYGVVYGPETIVERGGDAGFFGSIVARELILSGDGGIHADDSLDLSILSQGPRLSILVE